MVDAISRPSRDSIIGLTPGAFQGLRDSLGPFDLDVMASTASAQRAPRGEVVLPFVSQLNCPGSTYRLFERAFSKTRGTGAPVVVYCFPLQSWRDTWYST